MCKRFSQIMILFVLLTLCSCFLQGQNAELKPGEFYHHHLLEEQRAIPLPYVREDDVVWEHIVWRNISFREKFNQFFYYPLDRKGVQGNLNFAYMLWQAVEQGLVPIYEDDELLIPIDNAAFIDRYTRPDTIIIEIQDEEDLDMVEYRSVAVPREFNSEDVLYLRVKEAWYLDKQTTGQYVRILALALTQDMFKEVDGDRDFLGTVTLFWIPMLSPQVRDLLVRRRCFFNPNLANLPSWDRIFTERYFDSYIYRESNRFNRTISSYLTGEEAMAESERIENHLLEISLDQWEW